MKTTVEIATPLLTKAKVLAANEKTTLRALIEEGLRHVLQRSESGQKKPFKLRDGSVHGTGLTPEAERKIGWNIRKAAYAHFDWVPEVGEDEK